MWRMQYLSEMRVGKRARKQAAMETASVDKAKEAFD